MFGHIWSQKVFQNRYNKTIAFVYFASFCEQHNDTWDPKYTINLAAHICRQLDL